MSGGEPTPGTGVRGASIAAATTALVLIAAAFATTARRGAVFHSAPGRSEPARTFTPPPARTAPVPLGTAPPRDAATKGSALAWVIDALLAALVVGLVAWLVVGTVRVIRRRREYQRSRPTAQSVTTAIEVVDAVRESVAASQSTLDVGTPTNAIIACWVTLEEAVARAGIPPRPSETSAELALRILSEISLDSAALQRLAVLYREARFSDHPLTERHREQARAALAQVAYDLPRGSYDSSIDHEARP